MRGYVRGSTARRLLVLLDKQAPEGLSEEESYELARHRYLVESFPEEQAELHGRAAVLRAADHLREALRLLNLADSDDTYERRASNPPTSALAASGEDTAWEAAELAITRILSAVVREDNPAITQALADDRARYVLNDTYDNGEDITYTLDYHNKHGWPED